VVTGGASQERPSWAPDGRRLTFYADDGGDWEVYTVARDGSDRRRLTRRSGFDGQPAWRPTSLSAM
jgi:Tol biopolymer transport system component